MNTLKQITLTKHNLLFYFFLLLYTAVMIYLCSEINIWMDEAYTLDTTSAKYSFSQVIHQSYFFESQPPVYFIIVWLWRKISATIFFARFFSLLSVAVAGFYFFKIIIKLTTPSLSKWLMVIFLLNPFVVFIGLEIRLYAFLLALSTAAIYYYLIFLENNNKKHLFVFLGISLISMYTQYFFAFLIAGLLFATLVFYGFKKAFTIALYVLLVVTLFLPNVFVMSSQLGMVQTQKFDIGIMQRINSVFHSPQNLLFSLESLQIPRWIRQSILILFAAVIISSYFKAYKKNRSNNSNLFRTVNFLLISTGVAVIIMSIFIAIARIDYVDRYLTIVMPVLILIFSFISAFDKRIVFVLYTTVFLYLAALFIYNYAKPIKQYDYKIAASFLEKKALIDEPIFFYHSTLALPFRYYYRGKNATVPVPHEVPFDNTYMDNAKDTIELKNCINNNVKNTNSFLLVSDLAEVQYKNDANRKMVNDYLNSHYRISYDTLFFGRSKTRPLRIRRYFYNNNN